MKHDTTTIRITRATRARLKRYAVANEITMKEAVERAVTMMENAK